jgi:hypothetical protein
MSNALIQRLIPEFFKNYDAEAKDLIWQQQSATFRHFWSDRVTAPGAAALSDMECDAIIRILDTSGKGKTKDSEVVAMTGLNFLIHLEC